ncbi:sugar kinase [Thermoanaerobacterium thermosaccharolyticum]|uniref:ROK family protein n=1 Tax=Thermoanaerobacterium thermosaccharolyticum (strain ATCC 7956 / DSM 571 / NCIMB 9385 / NCA 3814 / NCTC 13789 / WDCM 00135 / 2032) TaxID=580327 RepID=D9TPV9_THETC|nr:ROK family transcriptional regulator [Thermoanaerobacterium thermosaccharolyticum]ADL69128.1 ROK family protein [Thermoanaerobacterium thermosaccharolyticum DSM 571]PHO06236.1 sugar kinase [Thermoanaerobacterium thermosaccharolyticum]
MTQYRKGTNYLIKNINTANVLDVIKKMQPISRIKISKVLNMSKSTVSGIVDELIKEGLVSEEGYGKTTSAGRKPIELTFNPNAKFSIGIDIESTNTIGVLTNLEGKIIKKIKRPTGVKDEAFDNAVDIIRELLDCQKEITGIGVGAPGITNIEKGTVYAPGLSWVDFNLLPKLKEVFDYDIFIDNSVNYAALGERWIGSCKDVNNFVLVTIGNGIGSGIYINGKLVRGHKYSAGEVGYMAIGRDILNKKYFYEDYGYFESKASLLGLVSSLKNLSNGKFNTMEDFINGYLAKDEICIRAFNEFIENLSMGFTNIISILNPELIVIAGDVINLGINIVENLKRLIDKMIPFDVKIIYTKLNEDAAAIGASADVLLKTNYLILI